jgi:hypothetical protein
MDELFDVFDDKPQSEIPQKPKKAKKDKKDKSKKRTANGDVKKDQDGDEEMVDTEQLAGAADEESNGSGASCDGYFSNRTVARSCSFSRSTRQG